MGRHTQEKTNDETESGYEKYIRPINYERTFQQISMSYHIIAICDN